MAAELLAGLGAIKTAFDLAKGLKDIDDATRRNAAIIELQEKILSAQETQAMLVKSIDALETKVASFEKWDAEKERYQLKDFGGNSFAYELKANEARGEPMHRICPNCYEKGQKAILQFKFRSAGRDKWICNGCNTEFEFGHPAPPRTTPRGDTRAW